MGEAETEATKKAISASEIKISNLPGEEDAQKKRLLDEAHERAMHRMAIQKAMKKFTEEAQLILHTGRMRCDLGPYLRSRPISAISAHISPAADPSHISISSFRLESRLEDDAVARKGSSGGASKPMSSAALKDLRTRLRQVEEVLHAVLGLHGGLPACKCSPRRPFPTGTRPPALRRILWPRYWPRCTLELPRRLRCSRRELISSAIELEPPA
jgi:hypothetical protein